MSRVTIKWEGPANQSLELSVFGVPVRLQPGETVRRTIDQDGKWQEERFFDGMPDVQASG